MIEIPSIFVKYRQDQRGPHSLEHGLWVTAFRWIGSTYAERVPEEKALGPGIDRRGSEPVRVDLEVQNVYNGKIVRRILRIGTEKHPGL